MSRRLLKPLGERAGVFCLWIQWCWISPCDVGLLREVGARLPFPHLHQWSEARAGGQRAELLLTERATDPVPHPVRDVSTDEQPEWCQQRGEFENHLAVWWLYPETVLITECLFSTASAIFLHKRKTLFIILNLQQLQEICDYSIFFLHCFAFAINLLA